MVLPGLRGEVGKEHESAKVWLVGLVVLEVRRRVSRVREDKGLSPVKRGREVLGVEDLMVEGRAR